MRAPRKSVPRRRGAPKSSLARPRRGKVKTRVAARPLPTGLDDLLHPYAGQSVRFDSMVVAGCRPPWTEQQFRRGAASITSSVAAEPARASPGPLLIASPQALAERLGVPGDFPWRAVAVVSSDAADPRVWALERDLFDRGLVGIGAARIPGGDVRGFLASDAIRSVHGLGAGSRGRVTVTCLGRNGRFANQLFQYAYGRLYALRHGATAAFPAWEGRDLFGCDDPIAGVVDLPQMVFKGFSDDDRRLWERPDPPVDIDLWGYFQEIPECWRRHRDFLRSLFQLSTARRRALDAWRDHVTDGGRRTLVAVHVRRGDYRAQRPEATPWFRLVPEAWYVAWLRSIWPTLRDPRLFVATDEPRAVLPHFREFNPVSMTLESGGRNLPRHVRDFEALRRADCLAVCNSSFSRMAAILAPATQRCVLPSFDTQAFEPYEPWIDPAFWVRFAHTPRASARRDKARHTGEWRAFTPTRTDSASTDEARRAESATYLDVTDLVSYVEHHTTMTGIQRVQTELIRHLTDAARPDPIPLVMCDEEGALATIDTSALQAILDAMRAGALSKGDVDDRVRRLYARAMPLAIHPGDVFLNAGAFWSTAGVGLLFQDLKNRGAILGLLVHDILALTDREYFNVRGTRICAKGMVEALTFADFIVTTSDYNKTTILAHMAARAMRSLPVRVVTLAHELPGAEPRETGPSDRVAAVLGRNYVLCVGTIEVRKNPTYLFNIWRLMRRSGRADVPTLVFAGRQGWLVRDLMEQLEACGYLDGTIVVLHDVTDAELALLYRHCLLTMFPSLVEGWGLPVGESLAHGKICLASHAGGILEVGGDLADAIDPYNPHDGLARLTRYLDDPDRRRAREEEIRRRFAPRSWRTVADEFIGAVRDLSAHTPRSHGVAAIPLPPGEYLPISGDPGALDSNGLDGGLSADVSCVSGWQPPERWGIRAGGSCATLRFRTGAAAGTPIHVVLRLAAPAYRACDVRVVSGSGHEVIVSLARESDKMAALPCQVELDGLVTLRLSLANVSAPGAVGDDAWNWGLKGFLYFEPGRAIDRASSSNDARSVGRPIRLGPAPRMDESRCAPSLDAFRQALNAYWPRSASVTRRPPIVADEADRAIFTAAHAKTAGMATEQITLVRRSRQYVSMSRFSEGSIFDRAGVSRAMGYLQGSPPVPWLMKDKQDIAVRETSLAEAPRHDGAYLVFFNGNLHNYYHWMTEAILSLEILTQSLGSAPDLRLALPASMDVNALFDHRESLRAVGLDRYPIEEVAADFIRVREAIWVESDLVQSMPGSYLREFQQRVAARYADSRGARNKRLLVARKGPTRRIRNLPEVEALLSRHGFETVYLEGLSITDQILLFQRAEFVIGPHGAGLTNLLFCEPGTKVIELSPSVEIRPFFWLISEKLRLVHGLQLCAPADGTDFQASIHVDVGKLETLYRLVEAGASTAAAVPGPARRRRPRAVRPAQSSARNSRGMD